MGTYLKCGFVERFFLKRNFLAHVPRARKIEFHKGSCPVPNPQALRCGYRIASGHPVPKPALSTWDLCMLDRLSLFHQARIASGPNHAVSDLKATLLRAARGFLSGP